MGRVYVTGVGRLCPDCDAPIKECRCKKQKHLPPRGDGKVRVQCQVKGRGGKTVTVITGLPLEEAALKDLASELKRRFGAGGGVKEGTIEIQGDYVDQLLADMKQRGYEAKRAG